MTTTTVVSSDIADWRAAKLIARMLLELLRTNPGQPGTPAGRNLSDRANWSSATGDSAPIWTLGWPFFANNSELALRKRVQICLIRCLRGRLGVNTSALGQSWSPRPETTVASRVHRCIFGCPSWLHRNWPMCNSSSRLKRR